MATKKRKEQLENLLEWERDNRLPETKNLFNRQIGDRLFLYEISPKVWNIALVEISEDGTINNRSTILKHETLIQLGLSILDAVAYQKRR